MKKVVGIVIFMGVSVWLVPKFIGKVEEIGGELARNWQKADSGEKAALAALIVLNFVPLQYYLYKEYVGYLEEKNAR